MERHSAACDKESLGGMQYYKSKDNTKHQTPNTEHQTPNTEHQTPNTEHQTPNTEHQTPNNEHTTPNTQHRTRNTEHATPNPYAPLASIAEKKPRNIYPRSTQRNAKKKPLRALRALRVLRGKKRLSKAKRKPFVDKKSPSNLPSTPLQPTLFLPYSCLNRPSFSPYKV